MRFLTALCLLSLLAVPARAAEPLRVLAYETEPFFYRTATGPAGLEYEILQYYAKTSGRELAIRWVDDFDQIMPMIQRGEADLAAATMTVTPDRERLVDFSASYFPVRVMLVEPKGRETTDLAQLRGATLATMRGTTYEKLLSAVPQASFVYGTSERELWEIVQRGDAVALAADSAVALPLLPDFPGMHLTLPLSEEQDYGFAVRDGSPLAEELTRHIGQLKSSKIYFRLLEKHFGEEAVRAVTAARNR